MQSELLIKKLKEFKKYIKHFLMHKKHDIEDIHVLRVKSRELSSVISDHDPFFNRVKKVINLSNEIRDMDVFGEVYLNALPKKYRNKLDLKYIKNSIRKKRKKKITRLHTYVQFLVIPPSAISNEVVSKSPAHKNTKIPLLEKTQLHKYRITIKKRLYNEKNRTHCNKKKVKYLRKTKDLLGTINDNFNGLKTLKNFDIQPKLYDLIQAYTEKENLKIFIKFKKIEAYNETKNLEN